MLKKLFLLSVTILMSFHPFQDYKYSSWPPKLRWHLSSMVLVVFIGVRLWSLFQVPPVPILENKWWGSGEARDENDAIKPFKINISDDILFDLKNRLKNTRKLPAPLEGIQQQYGFNTNTLNEIIEYWLNKYNWRKREQYLNQFPQFQTQIQGLTIHYLHIKPTVPPGTPVLPLLIAHGWAGSVCEFYKIIPLLTKVHEKYGFAFEIVAPSLPGFGFSSAAAKPGLGAAQIGMVFKNLMKRIGHERFYVQGGDWGAVIIKNLATIFPENVLGLHSNMAITLNKISLLKTLLGSFYPPLVVAKEFEHKMYPLSNVFQQKLEDMGYFHMQATKPDTIGVGMHDSPAGLAAYILEIFSTATNVQYRERKDAGLLEKFTYDELIDNLMIYWVTGSFTSSSRIYAESINRKQYQLRLDDIPINASVPCAIARFPNEIYYQTDWILKTKFTNLVQTTDFKEGGHFAAMEVPTLLAQDIFSAVDTMRQLAVVK